MIRNSSSTSSTATRPSVVSGSRRPRRAGRERVALDAALGRAPRSTSFAGRRTSDVRITLLRSRRRHLRRLKKSDVRLRDEVIHTGIVPSTVIRSGEAVAIATGGMMPRGADAVVMVSTPMSAPPSSARRAVTPAARCRLPVPTSQPGDFRRGQPTAGRARWRRRRRGRRRLRKPIVAILSTVIWTSPREAMQPARSTIERVRADAAASWRRTRLGTFRR